MTLKTHICVLNEIMLLDLIDSVLSEDVSDAFWSIVKQNLDKKNALIHHAYYKTGKNKIHNFLGPYLYTFVDACILDDLNHVKFMIKNFYMECSFQDGIDAACKMCSVNTIKYLFDNFLEYFDTKEIFYFHFNDNEQIFKYMMDRTYSKHRPTKEDIMLKMIEHKSKNIVNYLLEIKTKPDVRGNTAVIRAIQVQDIDILDNLIKHGASVNDVGRICNKIFISPLQCAVDLNNLKIVILLIFYGADKDNIILNSNTLNEIKELIC